MLFVGPLESKVNKEANPSLGAKVSSSVSQIITAS